ncbi:uncharacterized protein HMPREF1541_06186 [Cyphellophora europaea CBS 101466]|uniref:L-ornithine N(5)-monooxygenase n=1 Tax=Cyphellophora europaea (strain CBS 101466) TaxID=1220924 RepID=W2RWA0_CYPE1|nr:uncharacterized protein HMPREF1541_06186 [Cyphellophora europaea CBS 101466]ETN39959.1 hypothetical protein HMPREF1541_06186 [Cyphellophora europaea CBS 101466]
MFTDVLIIGAGPCGLAVAARLSESTPSALFTDDEHARYWKRFKMTTLQSEAARKRKHCNSSIFDSGYEIDENSVKRSNRPSMAVLDASSDEWLGAWKSRFQRLNIKHLRSPLFFHPDPRDRDGLLAYAHEQGRESELVEIPNIAGKEYSKHAQKKQRNRQHKVERHLRVDGRDRIDYYTPSTALFEDYCDSIVERYGLHGLVHKASVRNISYDDVGGPSSSRMFCVDTDKGMYMAKIVIVATGPASAPCLPEDHRLELTATSHSAASHIFSPNGLELPASLADKLKSRQATYVVIVGGGLTSAQVAVELISSDVTHVWLLLRGKYKLKHFDVDLEWVSKVRNQRMAEFWSADTDSERAEMFKQARNGGSITPAFDRELQKLVRAGKLSISPHTTIDNGSYYCGGWNLTTSSHLNLPPIDHVFYATGVRPDFTNIAFLDELRSGYPISAIGGHPVIGDDLMYEEDLPLFFTGALAALRLGPGAANLAGARQGAERIAWKVEELLGRQSSPSKQSTKPPDRIYDELSRDRSEFTGGWTNQFDALQLAL